MEGESQVGRWEVGHELSCEDGTDRAGVWDRGCGQYEGEEGVDGEVGVRVGGGKRKR